MFAFMRRAPFTVMALLLCLILTGCMTSPTPSPEFSSTAAIPYRLDSGDKLRVTVFGQESLTGNYSVDSTGNLSMPLVGSVQARGTTTTELRTRLAGLLSREYLRDPDVSVEVETYRPFFILGEVKNPGQYPYVAGMTVQTAAAIAGGFTPRARTDVVEITRLAGNRTTAGYAAAIAAVRPGDTINVAERYF